MINLRKLTKNVSKASLTAVGAGLVLVAAPVAAAEGYLVPVEPVLSPTRCDVTVQTTNPENSGWKLVARVDGVLVSNPANFSVPNGSSWTVAERAVKNSQQTFPNGKTVMAYRGTAPDETYCHDTSPIAKNASFNASWNSTGTTNLFRLASDPDVGDTVTLTSVSNPNHLTVKLMTNGKSASYTAEPDYLGTAGFDYTVTDSFGKTATGHVTINFVQPT